MKCSCFWTDPSTWTIYCGVAEPASQREWNPDCPEHGDTPIERETAMAVGFWATGIVV